MPEKPLHVHVQNFSPVLRKGMDGLISGGVYRSKAELIRAGIRSIIVEHCPELLKLCEVKEDDK